MPSDVVAVMIIALLPVCIFAILVWARFDSHEDGARRHFFIASFTFFLAFVISILAEQVDGSQFFHYVALLSVPLVLLFYLFSVSISERNNFKSFLIILPTVFLGGYATFTGIDYYSEGDFFIDCSRYPEVSLRMPSEPCRHLSSEETANPWTPAYYTLDVFSKGLLFDFIEGHQTNMSEILNKKFDLDIPNIKHNADVPFVGWIVGLFRVLVSFTILAPLLNTPPMRFVLRRMGLERRDAP